MATFWRYVRIQLVVFVFGIVGPIFLAVFFATRPEPSMKWAYWAGLFITAADVLIALAITDASDPAKKPVAKRRQSGRSHTSGSSSSSYDPFSATAFTFSTDSGSSSSDSGWSSSDSGSSSSDSGSSSSSDSGSSSSSD